MVKKTKINNSKDEELKKDIHQLQNKIKDIQLRLPSEKPDDKLAIYNKVSSYNIALEFIVATFVGIFIGYFLDKFFASKPICVIIFSMVGMLAGFKLISRQA